MKPLVEGEDFTYNEKGLVVLTDNYLLKRGYCCGNWCLNCPYNYEKVPEPRRTTLLQQRKNNEQQKKD